MKTNKNVSLTVLTLTALLTLGACSDDKGEETGEKIDQLITETKDAAEDTSDNTKNAFEDASDKVKDAAKDAKDKVKDLATDTGNAIEDACEKAKEKLDTEDTDC